MSRRRSARRKQRAAQARKRRLAYAGVLVGATLVLILVIVAVRSSQPSIEELASADVIATGQRVFEQNCATCHGAQGEGHAAVPQAPALNDKEHAWHHPDGQLQQVILNGGQIMPPFRDKLTNEEIIAVVRYIQGWWRPDQLAAQQAQSEKLPFIQ